MMRNSCLALSDPSTASDGKVLLQVRAADTETPSHTFRTQTNPDSILNSPARVLQLGQNLFTATEAILSPGHLESGEDVSGLLVAVENAIMLIGPQLKDGRTKTTTTETGTSGHQLSCDVHIVLYRKQLTGLYVDEKMHA